MRSPRKPIALLAAPGSVAVAAVAVAALVWAGANAGPAETELAAVQENGCQVVAGNGKVVTQPSAKCPVSIALGGPLSVPAQAAVANLAPGDTVSRRLEITNDGKNTLDSIVMSATPSSDDIDASLRLTVKRCTNTSCTTTATPALADGVTLPMSGLDLGASPAKTKGGVDRLLVSVQLLSSAGNALQGASTTLTYTFTATKN